MRSDREHRQHSPRQTRLLRALPPDDYARITADLELVSLDVATVLHKSGEHPGFLHFPTTAAVAGLISYTRGSISVLDRKKLEECACECYSVVKTEVNRLLPSSPPSCGGTTP